MKKLIIITDIHGSTNDNWSQHYITVLENNFTVDHFDSCHLADIDPTGQTESSIHEQFINGGIDRAVNKLLDLQLGEIAILGFSIGGTIGWKYCLSNTSVASLTCASSTRLRYETVRPDTSIQLIYGEDDRYAPNDAWFAAMNIEPMILERQGHNFYRELAFVDVVVGVHILD